MKLPLSWLKDYVDLKMSVEKISHILTMAGLEVDSIEEYIPPFTGVVVGEVLETVCHPDADKLCCAKVSDGENVYDVVCGAPNCRAGLRVAFAKIGAVLYDSKGKAFKIKKSKIRGVESYGMLCSGDELSLSEDDGGILELGDNYSLGCDLAEFFSDTVFEISLTPNLGHCNSVIGVARELAANLNQKIKIQETDLSESKLESVHKLAQVLVEDRRHSLRYACRVIKDIKVAPSPLWMQMKLKHCGVRSVNNVVDATNLVLMELGHPLHAFDYNLLSGHQVIVRQAQKGQEFQTLDGEKRILNEETLLICDHDKPVALAGIMGGANSEVSEETTDILIESAYFEATNIRRTSKALSLSTEASKRFERGVDPNNVIEALDRVAALIQSLAGGEVAAGIVDVKDSDFYEKVVNCRLSRINKVIGIKLSANEVQDIFTRLEFVSQWDGDDTFIVRVPTFRNDIFAEIDLIEEVLRVYGYDNIPQEDVSFTLSHLPNDSVYLLEKEVRQRLISEGLQDFINCDLISPSQVKLCSVSEDAIIKIINPTSIEQSVLRPSLLPGLLSVVKYNIDHGTIDISGFEVGRIHYKNDNKYEENSMASVVLTGNSRQLHWNEDSLEVDFFTIKGVLENLFEGLNFKEISFKASHKDTFHPGRQAVIIKDGIEIGVIGEIHPTLLEQQGIEPRVLFSEINLDLLLRIGYQESSMSSLPQYPGSTRDWTLTVRHKTSIQEILDGIAEVPSKLLKDVKFISLYEDDNKLGEGWKNVTFSMLYRDDIKTVSFNAADREHARIIGLVWERLEKKGLVKV